MGEEILIVDDQPGIRLLLSDILLIDGYRVTTANTGEEALSKLTEKKYDLLILDYKLPVINGRELIEKLIKKEIYIPIIVMSGLVENFQEDIERIPLVKKVLAKPFNVLEISKIVSKVIKENENL